MLKLRSPGPGLHQSKCDQQGKGSDSPPPLCSGESPSEALHPVLGSLAQEGHGPVGEECHEDDQRDEQPLLDRLRVGVVQPGEKKDSRKTSLQLCSIQRGQ